MMTTRIKPRWRRKALTLTFIVVGVLVAALLTVLLYLRFGDLTVYRDSVARLVSDALGREVRIAGEFAPDIGLSSRLVASDLSLSNPWWSSAPAMVTIERLAIEVDLWSLVSGPLRIVAVDIAGANVRLEDGGEGRVNWHFDLPKKAPGENAEPFQIVIEKASIQDLDFAFLSPPQSFAAGLGSFGLRSDDAAVLTLNLSGHVEGVPLVLSGTVDSLPGVIAGGPIRHDLAGEIGDIAVSLKGSIADLGSLGGTDVELDVRGRDLTQITQMFGVEGVDPGPFELTATVRPSEEGFDVGLNAAATDLEIGISALLDSLLTPTTADLRVSAHGPSAAPVASMIGVEGLPAEPFGLTGGVRWQGWPITFDAVEVEIGDNKLTMDGVLGAPPLMEGTRFEIHGSGPDARSVGSLVGLHLPPGGYSVDGRVTREENTVRLHDIEVGMGRARLDVTGFVGDPPAYEGTDLSIHARGPDLSAFQRLAGIDLPALAFNVSGELVPGDGAIALKGVEGRVGENSITLGGRLTANEALVGTRLSVRADGPDASRVASIFNLDGVPSMHYLVDGELAVERGGVRVRDLQASLGELALGGEGLIVTTSGMVGTEAKFVLAGPDVSFPVSLVHPIEFPSVPFTVGGAVRVAEDAYHLTQVTAAIDGLEVAVDGRIGAEPGLIGTDARLQVRGPRLTTLGALLQQPGWPATAFDVAAGLRAVDGGWHFTGAVVDLGSIWAEGSGTIVPVGGLVGSEFELEVEGDNLEANHELLEAFGLGELPELPEKDFSGMGRFAIADQQVVFDRVNLTLGKATAALDGSFGYGARFFGTDLRMDVYGPDASLLTSMTGVSVPIAPFRLKGRVTRRATDVLFDQLTVRLADYRAEIDGSLGERPTLAGTDLQVGVQGPSTALLGEFIDLHNLPDVPFQIDGHFEGNPEVFSMSGFSARYGDSDVKGSFRADLTGTIPEVEADFQSGTIDLRPFLPSSENREENMTVAPDGGAPPTADQRVIPDQPVVLPFLDRVNAKVRWTADFLELPLAQAKDLDLGMDLRDGALQVDPISLTGSHGGVLTGRTVVGSGERGLTIRSRLAIDSARLQLSEKEKDPGRWPTLDLDLNINTYGRSVRELAVHSNGWYGIVLGEGVIGGSIMDLLAADILLELFEALNPFAKEQGETHLDCAVIMLKLTDGVVALDPMAVQTERMTIIGDGSIDLTTEKIKLDWITKPRRGLGLSASTITNPYIRLGGTLSQPSVELKPLDAAVSTGAAVATVGISLAARGLWNRITSERKVCKKAREQAEAQIKEE